MITFRDLEQGDLELIAGFPRTAEETYFMFPKARHPLTPEQLAAAAAERRCLTVALDRTRVVAYANFYHWEEGGTCAVGNLVVHPDFRSQGLASALMGRMIERAVEEYSATRLEVACFSPNTAALLLYRKLGFTPFDIRERRDHHNRPVALVMLEKNIT